MYQPRKRGFGNTIYEILVSIGFLLILILPLPLMIFISSYYSLWKSVNYTPLADIIIKCVILFNIILAILLKVIFSRELKSILFKSWVFAFVVLLCIPALSFTITQSAMVTLTEYFGWQGVLTGKVIEKYESKKSIGYHTNIHYHLIIDNKKHSQISVSENNYHKAHIGQTVKLIHYQSPFLDYVDFDDIQLVNE